MMNAQQIKQLSEAELKRDQERLAVVKNLIRRERTQVVDAYKREAAVLVERIEQRLSGIEAMNEVANQRSLNK